MNRYVLEGLLADLQTEKKVLLVMATMTDAQRALDDLAALADGTSFYLGDNKEHTVAVFRAAGNYRLVLRHGYIRILSGHQSARGYSPDVLVVDQRVSTYSHDLLPIANRAEVIQL